MHYKQFLFFIFSFCAGYSFSQSSTAGLQGKFPTIYGFYPDEVLSAYAGGNAKILIPALVKNFTAFELKNSDAFARVHYLLFIAHTYELLNQHHLAVPYYKKAAGLLPQASFISENLAGIIKKANPDNSYTALTPEERAKYKDIEKLLMKKDDWQKIRMAYLYYVELGSCGDAESLKKGEELIKTLPDKNNYVNTRKLLFIAETLKTAANCSFEMKELYPDQVAPDRDYFLPFLKNAQVFSITVKNNGNTLLVLNSDDFKVVSGKDTVASIPDDKIAAYVSSGLPYEQFICTELSPVTFSSNCPEDFNRQIVNANTEAYIAIEKAKEAAWQAKMDAERAARQQAWLSIGDGLIGISSSILEGVNAASASIDRNEASRMRSDASSAYSSGNYSQGRYLESQARWKEQEANSIQNDIAESHKRQEQDRYMREQQLSGLKATARQKEYEAESMMLTASADVMVEWDKTTANQAVNFEYYKVKERAYGKLEEFALANIFLPKRGSVIKRAEQSMTVGELFGAFDEKKSTDVQEDLGAAIRVKPGETWKGLVCFDINRLPAATGILKVNYKAGEQKGSFTMQYNSKTAYVFSPPLFDFENHFVVRGPSWGDSDLGSGTWGWGYTFNWYALFPELKKF